jgi:GT2 family glycosyltransferase
MSESAFGINLWTRLRAALRGPARPARLRLAVDLPEPETESDGSLVIHGWAFSRGARIVEVEGRLGSGPPRSLSYGVRRPDVARAYANPDADCCGFEGTLVFDAAKSRTEQLVVRATDDTGERAEVRVRVRVVARRQPVGDGDGEPQQASAVRALGRNSGGAVVDRRVLRQLEDAVLLVRDRLDRDPTILDWNSGVPLADVFPDLTVFAPSTSGDTLPYFDRTVDVVAVDARNAGRLSEAARVAAVTTLTIRADAADADDEAVTVSWLPDAPAAAASPSISIVIPVHDQAAHTDACLAQLIATLPPGFLGEILVVDDASADETGRVLKRWAERSELVRVLRNDTNEGFLHSCNRGAAAAAGEILVFLNNDTLPRPGWLPPLVRVLRDDPAAGAVGGKLLFPDGTLQEAGGVIFSDGTGCNFGKFDPNPNAPLYNFVREVDYCSGALLAIRRAVFREVGGLDTRYSPAYYEDTDLCFRLRDKGYRVYYQPASVVVHEEGASSGTDPESGVKRYQTINRDKFVERWHDVLARQPPAPAILDAAARRGLWVRDSRPRALVCAPRMPEFDRESGSRRVFHLIELLQDEGWAVSFVALDPSANPRYVRALQQRGVATYTGLTSSAITDQGVTDFDGVIAHSRFDVAILAFWDVGERLLPRLRSLSPTTRVIVDSVDLHFLRDARGTLRRAASHERGTLKHDYADRMIRELNTYAAADAVLTVSQKEADYVNDMTGQPSLASAVPDMEELSQSPLDFASRRGLLFVGNFRHAPNLEGLRFFVADILPRLDPALRADHPLTIVGNEVDEHVAAAVAGLAHVNIVGWVPSLGPYLDRARVSVIPLLHGAGTKRKLIQALMAGTPSVSTPIGIEGLGLTDDEDVMVGASPTAFAEKVTQLLQDPIRWRHLAMRGRDHVARTHSRAAVRARFHEVMERGGT